jgi:hypothetical protein
LRMTPDPCSRPHLTWGRGEAWGLSCLTAPRSLMRVTFFDNSPELSEGSGKARKALRNRPFRH